MSKRPSILITNDDGIKAKGLFALIEMVQHLGEVIVVAPEDANSGMSHAITIQHPLRIRKHKHPSGIKVYSVNGTPVDCVKLAMNQLVEEPPQLVLSGINHGSNSSVSIFYSGTMAAAIEGSLYGIPSIGLSLLNHHPDADFAPVATYCTPIIEKFLNASTPKGMCLNINVPSVAPSEIKGINVCRQNMGAWREEFEKRTDPRGQDYYWLTGHFHNDEPNATDTDEYLLSKNIITIVPIRTDLTQHSQIKIAQQILGDTKPSKP